MDPSPCDSGEESRTATATFLPLFADGRGIWPGDCNAAALTIQRAWISHSNKKTFGMLKSLICRAEKNHTSEILRLVSPSEANLLNDPTLKAKIRFRFGGIYFPPKVFYKVFAQCSGSIYICGRDYLAAGTQGAEDALSWQGSRKYVEQLQRDSFYNPRVATQIQDVSTIKDRMNHLSFLDSQPATVGGRDNPWRELSLSCIPRQAVIDVFQQLRDYGRASSSSPSKFSSGRNSLFAHGSGGKSSSKKKPSNDGKSSRSYLDPKIFKKVHHKKELRSRKTPHQISQRSWRTAKQIDSLHNFMNGGKDLRKIDEDFADPSSDSPDDPKTSQESSQDKQVREEGGQSWEEEATKLFEWTQNLSIDKYYQEWDDSNTSPSPLAFGTRFFERKNSAPYSTSPVKQSERFDG